jgi:hypothetical protein
VAPKPRILWPTVLVVAIATGASWLVWAVWRSPHRSDLATFGAFAAAVATIAAGQIAWAKNVGARRHGENQHRALNHIADLLSGAVKDQWTRAALDRRLQPEPIPVRWARPSQPFSGPVSAAADSRQFPPLPGILAARPRDLQEGQLSGLHAVYGGLGSGRMMIVGTPGSGKSGAAVLLVLAALKHREQVPEKDRPLVPVPVMFTFHGWDPETQRIEDWLASQLQQTYPLFAGKGGAADGVQLIRAGRVAVILDGLDEIADAPRPVALQALSQQAAFRVVVLARSAEIAAAARYGLLEGAVALELQDIDPQAAADYLERVQLDPAPPGWRELTGRLRRAPHSPIAKALSSPLALTLLRDTYRSGDDVRELLSFCDASVHGVPRQDIEDHLLDRVLPAAYSPRPGEALAPYDLQTAQCALRYIAVRMNQDGTRDLAWWRIPPWTPAAPRIIATGLMVGVLVGLGAGLGAGLAAGLGAGRSTWLGAGLVFALLIGLTAGHGGEVLQRISLLECRQLFSRPGLGIGARSRLGFALLVRFMAGHSGEAPQRIGRLQWRQLFSRPVSGIGLGIGLGAGLLAGLVAGPRAGLVAGIGGGLGAGLVAGILAGLSQPLRGNASPLTPRASWQRDQAFGFLTGLLAGLMAGLVVGLFVGLVAGLRAALVAGLMVGLVFGLVSGLTYPKTWAASLAFVQLARRRHTPVRLMRFLEDARKRDVLRTVGPAYQFRHARLQDHLTGQASTATRPGQQTSRH